MTPPLSDADLAAIRDEDAAFDPERPNWPVPRPDWLVGLLLQRRALIEDRDAYVMARDELVEMLSEAREAVRTLTAEKKPHPGEPHQYRIECERCGLPGFLNVALVGPDERFSIEPITAPEEGATT